MFVGRGPGRVVERRAGAEFSPVFGPRVSKIIVGLPHRHGGAPEIEVRGLRLRRQGKGAGKTEARDNGHRAGGTDQSAPCVGEARERRSSIGGCTLKRRTAAPAGRQAVRRWWATALASARRT